MHAGCFNSVYYGKVVRNGVVKSRKCMSEDKTDKGALSNCRRKQDSRTIIQPLSADL